MTHKILEYDIVIIGSGAGGGTVAKELAPLCKKGCSIALLEWGGKFGAQDNTRQELPMAKKYYFDSGGFQTASQDMTLAFARAVGGSTTVYTGTSLKAPASVLENWGIEGLDLEDLEPRYEKYIHENNVHLLQETEINENNRLFADGCRRLGWSVQQFPVNVRGCAGLGTCNLGCTLLAKQGTARVQIPEAEQMGVHVFPFCKVQRIEDHDVIAEIIPPEHGLAASPLGTGHFRFRAQKIVLAAGAVNSPAILFRSLLNRVSPTLGKYFTCHPALILAGKHPKTIQNTFGHPKSFYCDQFWQSDRFLLETCIYFPFTLAKSICAFGQKADEFLALFDRLQMILVLVIDPALSFNRVTINRKGEPVVHYKFTEDVIHSFVKSIRASARIFFAAGAETVFAPCSQNFFLQADDEPKLDALINESNFKSGRISISAAHLMGGCRMGEDRKNSVTDSWGRVHGTDHLYVADGSLFPASPEVNPYLTIMAIADRVAEGVRRDLGVL